MNRVAVLQVQTVDGQVDLKIPSGTQPGTTLVMGKRGVPRLGTTTNTTRGDHNVRIIMLLFIMSTAGTCSHCQGAIA